MAKTQVEATEQIKGIVPVADGGTGIASTGSNGNVLTSSGGAWISSPPTGTTQRSFAYFTG